MRPGLVSGLAGRVAGAKTGGVLRPRPSEGRRTLGRGSALALERPLGLADERVAGGFPLDVALASPGELLGENRVHDPDVVPFDIVLGGLARGELVALAGLPREGVPFDIVLGGLARGELVARAGLPREGVPFDIVLGGLARGELVARAGLPREGVPFDIVLGGLARGELVALACLPREGVPFDIVLGGLARGELVALACPALARHWSPLLARVFVVARCLCCAGCATSRTP